jgi:hypothetical protein
MARKKKVKGIQTVTRIAIVGTLKLNKWKSVELDLISSRLGLLRSDLWNEFGSLKAWGISEYQIDKVLRPRNTKYQLPAKLWEATLYDVIGDIHAVQSSCVEKILETLKVRYQKVSAKKSLVQQVLESREWLLHPRLHKLVRFFYHRGHTKVSNQIVVKEYNCKIDNKGIVWIKFGGLTPGKTIKISTTLQTEITGQIRLIKRLGKWEIHYTTDIKSAPKRDTGLDIGVDRGYSEVYATSSNDDARFIGTNFGKLQTTELDYRSLKGVRRSKIRSLAIKAIKKDNSAKADRINRNNLGRIKSNNRESSFKGRIKTLVFTATVQLMQDAIKSVAYEDLTEQFSSKAHRSKRTKRNLSYWCKGVIADALTQVSSRVGCTVISVNPCYTWQLDSRHGVFLGIRKGDKFTCFDGVVLQSDTNAADNVLARSSDGEITRFTKYKVAKEILLERTRKFREQLNKVAEVTQEVWDSVFEAITGTDKPKTLDPKRKRTSKGNQRAKYEQLTLFDFG